jgi:hypothetical protein
MRLSLSLTDLPPEIINSILDLLDQNDLVKTSLLSRQLHQISCWKLYKTIYIVSSPIPGSHTNLNVSQLAKFVQHLSVANFRWLQKIKIYAQLSINVNDYTDLYARIYKLWDYIPNHQLDLVNFDITNLRNFQSINQFIVNLSTSYLEDDCVNVQSNLKINNLQNWSIFNIEELMELPYNKNLKHLNISIERANKELYIPKNLYQNFNTIEELYLNSSTSTSIFSNSFDKNMFANLKSLSITSSHSYKDNSLLTFNSLSSIIGQLQNFELKINCIHNGCTCINNFFNDMSSIPNNIEQFILINYKSLNLKQNLLQFEYLLSNPNFYKSLTTINSFYLNINDLIKLDSSFSNNFSIRKLVQNLQSLKNLNHINIPDFFNNWLKNISSIYDEASMNYFDLILNNCSCSDCYKVRRKFLKLSNLDSKNNFKHTFSKKMEIELNEWSSPNSLTINQKIEFNKPNLNFLSYLISELKKQSILISQNLFSISSIINFDEKLFIRDDNLENYKQLFMHSSLNRLLQMFGEGREERLMMNLGGVELTT